MRILHAYKIFLPEINGGIPAVIAALLRIKKQVRNEIVVARRFGCARRYFFDGVQVIATSSLGTLFSTPMAPAFPFVLLNRSRRADIVVHHMPFPLTDLTILMGLPKHTSLVVYWHAEIVGRSMLRAIVTPLIKRSLRRADKIVISSDANAGHTSLIAAHRAKVTIVPYGVDTAYWMTTAPEQRVIIDGMRGRHPRLIVAIGRLVHYKGYDVLLQAMTTIDATAIIIGEGKLRLQLEIMARELGIADRVIFAGSLETDQIKLWLHAARVFVLPSRSVAEAFGLFKSRQWRPGCQWLTPAYQPPCR